MLQTKFIYYHLKKFTLACIYEKIIKNTSYRTNNIYNPVPMKMLSMAFLFHTCKVVTTNIVKSSGIPWGG